MAGSESGRWIPIGEWNARKLRPAVLTVYKLFGSWSAAWQAAGFVVPHRWLRGGASTRYSADEILQRLREAAAVHGGTISINAWAREHRSPCAATIQHRFGSWSAACKAAGVERPVVTEADLLETIAQAWRAKGSPPSQAEWQRSCRGPRGVVRIGQQMGWQEALARTLSAYPDLADQRASVRSRAVRTILAVDPQMLTERERVIADELRAGGTLTAAGMLLGISREGARTLALRAGRKVASRGRASAEPRAEDVLRSLAVLWGTLGGFPSPADWNAWAGRVGEARTVAAMFGDWTTALLATMRRYPDLPSAGACQDVPPEQMPSPSLLRPRRVRPKRVFRLSEQRRLG